MYNTYTCARVVNGTFPKGELETSDLVFIPNRIEEIEREIERERERERKTYWSPLA